MNRIDYKAATKPTNKPTNPPTPTATVGAELPLTCAGELVVAVSEPVLTVVLLPGVLLADVVPVPAAPPPPPPGDVVVVALDEEEELDAEDLEEELVVEAGIEELEDGDALALEEVEAEEEEEEEEA